MGKMQGKRNLSIILKIIVVISAVLGTIISAYAGRDTFMGGSRVFMYFTIQSNIGIALICGTGLVMLMYNKDIPYAWNVVKFVGTVAITLTGVVFVIVLAPTLGDKAWNVQNVLTHVIVPIVSVIDFFIVMSGVEIKRNSVFYVIIPPLLYAIYAGIGYTNGWEFSKGKNYPYFFLNWGSPAGAFGFTNELPYMGSAWWIIALFVFLIAVGSGYLTIAKNIGRKRAKNL